MPIGNATWGDFTCDTQAEMLSPLNKVVIGTTCLRADVNPSAGGVLYICTGLPATDIANWAQYSDVLGGGGGGVTERAFLYGGTTVAAPGDARVNINIGAGAVRTLCISDIDSNGAPVNLDGVLPGDQVVLATAANVFTARYTLTAVPTDQGTWWQCPATLDAGSDASIGAVGTPIKLVLHLASGVVGTIPADQVTITDAGDYYAGADVEAALQQIGAEIDALELGGGGDGSAVDAQFGIVEAGVVLTPYRVTTSGIPVGLSGPCLIGAVMPITPGTGTLSIYDNTGSSDATKLQFKRAAADMVAGTPSSFGGGLLALATACYVENTTGGEFIIYAQPQV